MRVSGSRCFAAWLVAAGCAGPAFAAHPLQTEDTGTQGAGNVELENGLSWSRAGSARLFAYQPQVSYGVSPTFDLLLQPAWLASHDAGRATVRGLGDTNVDLKWRFFGEAPLSFAVRAGAAWATGRHGLGEPHGDVSVHALLVATVDAAPFTVHANLGTSRGPGGSGTRANVALVSGAVLWAADERWTFTLDAGAQSNPDPATSRWPGTWLAGAIYTVRPGLDLDIGYQSSVRAAVAGRQWLAGITYRFAP